MTWPTAERLSVSHVLAGLLLLASVAGLSVTATDLLRPDEPSRASRSTWRTLRESPLAEGPAEASITLVEIGDFTCDRCAQAHAAVRRFLDSSDGSIRFIFQPYTLLSRRRAAGGAAAAFCLAERAASAEAVVSTLYEVVRSERLDWNHAAAQSGVPGPERAEFRSCLVAESTAGKVIEQDARMRALRLGRPPVIVLNRTIFRGVVGVEALSAAVRIR